MSDKASQARDLDEQASRAPSLALAQALASRADRLRRVPRDTRLLTLPFFRN